jgi:arylsulfatase A-like enzyme
MNYAMKISAMKMQFYVSIMSFLFVGVVSAQSSKNTSKTNPNIIVFLVDDMGWQDTSLPFWTKATELNKRYHTPNMEKLAKEGMKFTNAYATPVCTPTRTSLLTGMNVTNHGVTNWTSPYKDNNSESRDEQMEPMSWNMNGLSPVDNVSNTVYATPFPKLLKEAGYFTVHVGKAHWGSMGTPGASPYNMGFMVNVSGHAAGHPQSYLAKDNYGNIAGKASVQAVPDLEEYYGSDTFLTEALTKEAIKSLDAPIRNKQPFFLNLSHYAVHDPIMGDNRFLKKYLDAGLDPNEAKYASLLEGMDKSLGDLMDFVKEKGIEKNTIIIFMSDNGGLSLTPPRGGLEHTQNRPLKAGKGSVYEGGIRVPMIVRWPEMVKPSTVANQYVIVEDFFPTILEIAKLKKYKTIQLVDGQSFLPILKNPNYVDNNRSLIWHSPHNWRGVDGPGINYYSAIRKGDWKLIYSMRTGKKELYNLAEDIGENNNLSDVNPVLVKSLSSLLSNVLRKNNAPMPSFKSTGKPVPMPDEVL